MHYLSWVSKAPATMVCVFMNTWVNRNNIKLLSILALHAFFPLLQSLVLYCCCKIKRTPRSFLILEAGDVKSIKKIPSFCTTRKTSKLFKRKR